MYRDVNSDVIDCEKIIRSINLPVCPSKMHGGFIVCLEKKWKRERQYRDKMPGLKNIVKTDLFYFCLFLIFGSILL